MTASASSGIRRDESDSAQGSHSSSLPQVPGGPKGARGRDFHAAYQRSTARARRTYDKLSTCVMNGSSVAFPEGQPDGIGGFGIAQKRGRKLTTFWQWLGTGGDGVGPPASASGASSTGSGLYSGAVGGAQGIGCHHGEHI